MPPKPIDISGKIFGIQKILKYCGRDGRWVVECTNCGYISDKFMHNVVRSKIGCRNCSGLPKGSSGFKRVFTQYATIAKQHNREFVLTVDQFRIITSSCCHYCGRTPVQLSGSNLKQRWKKSTWGEYHYNGIDRKDNTKGYTPDNSLPCCGECNHMKGSKTYDEFISWLDRLLVFRKPISNGKVQLLCGMIASGKSSYAKNAASSGCLIYNDDNLVTMLHGGDYTLYDKNLKVLYKSVEHNIIGTALAMQKTIIIDRGLNVSAKSRQRWINIAKSTESVCEAVVFKNEGPMIHAQRRVHHDARGHSLEYWLEVANTHQSNYSEPSYEEGFDKIHHISFDDIKYRKVF